MGFYIHIEDQDNTIDCALLASARGTRTTRGWRWSSEVELLYISTIETVFRDSGSAFRTKWQILCSVVLCEMRNRCRTTIRPI